MDSAASLKQFFYAVQVRLGALQVEVELLDDEMMVALDEALRLYRARSRNSIQEGYCFLETVTNQNEYFLPPEIDCVKVAKRMRYSVLSSNAAADPFAQAFLNYTIRGATSSSKSGGFSGLINYQALSMFEETIGRMFGEDCMFEFNEGKSRLFLWRKFKAPELIGLEVSALKSIDTLLKDQQSHRWLSMYVEAGCKVIVGEKYRKYSGGLPGAQGSVNLKGNEWVSEGTTKKAELDKELLEYGDNGYPPLAFFG